MRYPLTMPGFRNRCRKLAAKYPLLGPETASPSCHRPSVQTADKMNRRRTEHSHNMLLHLLTFATATATAAVGVGAVNVVLYYMASSFADEFLHQAGAGLPKLASDSFQRRGNDHRI